MKIKLNNNQLTVTSPTLLGAFAVKGETTLEIVNLIQSSPYYKKNSLAKKLLLQLNDLEHVESVTYLGRYKIILEYAECIELSPSRAKKLRDSVEQIIKTFQMGE